jgi:zinc protease
LLLPSLALARSTEPPKLQLHTLANGLEVVVVENHSVPLVTIEIASHNGSMNEPPDYNGLSHLYEHMFFKANQALPDQEAWMARAHELGIVWNGTTNTERVNYFVTTTSDHAKDALTFMRDAIVGPLFDQKELERERVVVTGELDRNEADPDYLLWHAIQMKLWAKYPSRKLPIGDRKTVLEATREKLQTIQRRFIVPNNSVLAVTGDVSASDVFAQVDAEFAGWARTDDPFVKYPLVTHPPLARSEIAVVEQPVEVVSGSFNWHGMSMKGPDVDLSYVADLVSAAYAERSSKFQKALVDSGACLSVNLSYFTQVSTGPIGLSFQATPDKVDDCVKAIVAELPKMRAPDYLSDEERQNAAHSLEVAEVEEREKPSKLADAITFWWACAGLDYYLGYVDHLYAVTPAQIARYFDDYVIGKPYVFGVLVSPEMKKKGLDEAHFAKLLGVGR